MRQGTVRRAYQASLARCVTVGGVWIVLALVGTSSAVMAQASARIVSIEGAGTTYQSIDRDGKPVTVRVPSQSAADIQGKDAQGNVTATVTALDLTQRRAKVQTSAGQTLVLEDHPPRSRRCRWARRSSLPPRVSTLGAPLLGIACGARRRLVMLQAMAF